MWLFPIEIFLQLLISSFVNFSSCADKFEPVVLNSPIMISVLIFHIRSFYNKWSAPVSPDINRCITEIPLAEIRQVRLVRKPALFGNLR